MNPEEEKLLIDFFQILLEWKIEEDEKKEEDKGK